MSADLTGRVVVVAGDDGPVAAAAHALSAAGAKVALVSRCEDAAVTVHLRADATDPEVWPRVAMHVEQHLGPVDAVVTTAGAAEAVTATFAADLRRRGHGAVVVLAADDDPADVVSRVARTQ